MSADMRYAIDNLARSASHAAWDMTVNTALVRKLIAAAELAEATSGYYHVFDAYSKDTADPIKFRAMDAAAVDMSAALIAYRIARSAPTR